MFIIADTNFVMYCVAQHVNIEEELTRLFFDYKLLIVLPVFSELKKFSLGKGRKKENAKIALQLLEKFMKEKKAILLKMKTKKADFAIIQARKKFRESVVATLDRELKARLKNTKFLTIKKSHLEIV